MLSRIWRVAQPILMLVLVACCAYLLWRDSYRPGFGRLSTPDPGRFSAHSDFPVRNFLGVNWLGGDYELPAGEDHCAVVLLRFEDGKFRGREAGAVFSRRSGDSRVVPFYVMWGPGPKGTRVVSSWPGFEFNNSPFFAHLNGGLGRSLGSAEGFGEVRGYRVIGYAMSSQTRAGQEPYQQISGHDIDFALRTRQFVLVLGLKTFATAEEAHDWLASKQDQAEP
jgi:hypothetical protein